MTKFENYAKTMNSHCWSKDGSVFSSVCMVVIGVSVFVFFVSIFCIFRIASMLRKMRKSDKKMLKDNQVNKNDIELQQCQNEAQHSGQFASKNLDFRK